ILGAAFGPLFLFLRGDTGARTKKNRPSGASAKRAVLFRRDYVRRRSAPRRAFLLLFFLGTFLGAT
ncbi:MAG TPA: hypothetical protein VKA19_14610, partial [Alphaproteobacteria bacterium]|nr:hypothetical protein [Alphaproteobacteria bacterium]